MAIACEFCQHPACWKYDINNFQPQDAKGSIRSNESLSPSSKTKTGFHFSRKNKEIVEHTGCLPTYKIQNFTYEDAGTRNRRTGYVNEVDFECDDSYDESEDCIRVSHDVHKQSRETSGQLFPINPQASLNLSLSKCLKKVRKRQEEVAKMEEMKYHQHTPNSEIKTTKQTLILDEQAETAEKMLVWVPGKKQQSPAVEDHKKEKLLTSTTIDGNLLPGDVFLAEPSKSRNRMRSPPGTRSFRNREKRLLEGFMPQIFESELQLQQYLQLCGFSQINDQYIDNRENIYVPSPLKTSRVEPCHKQVNAIRRYVVSKTEDTELDKPKRERKKRNSDDHHQMSAVKAPSNGNVTPKRRKRRNFKRYLQIKREDHRDLMEVARVSIPKRALRKYPVIEHHCKQSIRMNNLSSEIFIQPLTLSENSSSSTLPSTNESDTRGNDTEKETQSQPMESLTGKSSVKIPTVPLASPLSRFSFMSDGTLSLIREKTLDSIQSNKSRSTTRVEKNRSSVQFQDVPSFHEIDSRRVSTAPSLFNGIRSSRLLQDVKEYDEQALLDLASRSRATSAVSHQSSEFSYLNRELIEQTYDKYSSFTPFKTPLQSRHYLNSRLNSQDSTRPTVSQQTNKRTFPQSFHNLNEFLPVVEEDALHRKNLLQMSISPSFNMYCNQSKLSPSNIVPAEMKISKVQLLPAREKSPFLMKKLGTSEHQCPHTENRKSEEAVLHPLVDKDPEPCYHHVPPPSPAFSKASSIELSREDSLLCKNSESMIPNYNGGLEENQDVADSKVVDITTDFNGEEPVIGSGDGVDETTSQHMKNRPDEEACASNTNANDGCDTEVTSSVSGHRETTGVDPVPSVGKDVHVALVDSEQIQLSVTSAFVEECEEEETKADAEIESIQVSQGALLELEQNDDFLSGIPSPIVTEDFTEGLSLNLELDDNIAKAIENFDDFILSDLDDVDETDDDEEDEF